MEILEMVEVIEEWTPTKHTVKVNGITIAEYHWYGQSPVVEIAPPQTPE